MNFFSATLEIKMRGKIASDLLIFFSDIEKWKKMNKL